MKLWWLKRLRSLVPYRKTKTNGHALILLYHRIAELPYDPWLLCVTPQNFEAHLAILRKHANPMSLQGLVEALDSGNIPERSVVVTFDDGYADNLYNAKPLLEKFEIPATFFVETSHFELDREFYWDELERLLLHPGNLPETLNLTICGKVYEWHLGKWACYTQEEFNRQRRWVAWGQPELNARHSLYRSLHSILRTTNHLERMRALDALMTWAGTKPMHRQTHRTLSLAELSHLQQSSLIEIGAHTVTHTPLSALSESEQEHEIQGNRAKLEELLATSVTSFSYPFGNPDDYTAATVEILRKNGFTCACTLSYDRVETGSDRLRLPRVVAKNCKGGAFLIALSEWMDLLT